MALPEQMHDLAGKIAAALQAVVPARFRGLIRVVIDNGVVRAHDVTVEYRPQSPRYEDKH